ncbi:MAG: hypothetical protein ACW98F_03515 [Candidatus Hodarchaeales archaeon]|jgi:hypothetical protein
MNPDDLLDYLYEEIHNFLVNEAGEELGHDEIDITIETSENGELNIEFSIFLELTAYAKLNVEELTKKAIAYGGEIADKVCPPLVKLHISEHK